MKPVEQLMPVPPRNLPSGHRPKSCRSGETSSQAMSVRNESTVLAIAKEALGAKQELWDAAEAWTGPRTIQ